MDPAIMNLSSISIVNATAAAIKLNDTVYRADFNWTEDTLRRPWNRILADENDDLPIRYLKKKH